MTDKEKKYETEWSFSFENLGESISNTLSSLGVGSEAEIKTRNFAEPLEDATQARMVLEPTVGEATITALADSDDLIQADLTYVGEVRFEVHTTDETHKTVRLRQNIPNDVLQPFRDALGSFARRDELRWDMRLTPNIPLDVQINSGMTRNDFDLSGLQLTALGINGGTGKTAVKLPTMGGKYKVTINSGTGSLNLNIPDGAAIDLNVNNGAGKTEMVIGSGASVDAHLTGGVGQTVVTVPANAAVRVKATSGLGKINMPENFVRVKVEEFVATTGTWETANYQTAEQTINIRYEGGVGKFTIRLA